MKPTLRPLLVRLVLFALLLQACAFLSPDGSTPEPEETVPNLPIPTLGKSTLPPVEEATSALFLPVPGGTEITLLTPESGNGAYPVFAWETVDGADVYLLFLLEEDGGGYWAWEGADTEVILGGFDEIPAPGVDGPILLEPMQWAVVALSADEHFVASSVLRPVAP